MSKLGDRDGWLQRVVLSGFLALSLVPWSTFSEPSDLGDRGRAHSESHTVRIEQLGENFFAVHVLDLATGEEQREDVSLRLESLRQAHLVNGELMARGSLWHGGDALVRFGLGPIRVQDLCWGYELTPSPSGARYAFKAHYPRLPPQGHYPLDIVHVYDVERSAEENRLASEYFGSERHCGLPVFPETMASATSYRIFAHSRQAAEAWDSLTSEILWLKDGAGLVFTAWRQGHNFLVVVDLADGLDSPTIHRTEFAPEIPDQARSSEAESSITVKAIAI